MSSKVEICNQALANLGKAAIATLDNTSESGRQGLRFYDRALHTVLRDYPWQFAKKQTSLALLTTTVDGWMYLYAYPANCAKVRKVYQAENYDAFPAAEFEIFNEAGSKAIACDLESAKAEYTAIVTDPTLFDAQFEGAMVYALASELANPLTGNTGKRSEMLQLYAAALPVAHLGAATERKEQPTYGSRYLRRW